MSIIKEFKEFAMKGNAFDLAIGVVIGGAFQKIVNSLVNDIIMPLTAIFTGNIDYSDWKIVIANGAAEIGIGSFVNAIINFFVIAISIFLALKYINKINKKLEELNKEAMKSMRRRIGDKKLGDNETPKLVEPTTKVCPYCLSEIPHKAIKCSHCASELKVEKEEAVVRDGGEVNE
ncbi:MAG: large conductance mechanosensitive channel protein MscL [Clostridia bacterium]|nr:large conductance mechanosensitive channel protein MscL [Clostridia bacterium]MCI9274986.1 large conductance mechanosensitive channel protein MscL [Clostridia bacterium]